MVRKAKHVIIRNHTRRNLALSIVALAIALCVASIGLPALTASAAPASYVVDKKIASDNLNRSVANGWGSAQIGGTYKLSRASTFSGNGTAGIVSVPNPGMSQTATLSSASARDSVASIVVIFPRVPKTGNGIFAGLQLRSAGGSYYQAQLREGSSKNLTLSLLRVNGSTANQTTLVGEKVVGRNLAAGARINLEFQATGSDAVSLDARAWLDGAVRPEWQVSTTDSSPKRVEQSGALGVWTYVSSATAPQPISYDDIAEYALKPLPASTVTPTPVVSTPTASPTTTPMPSTTPTPPPTTPPTPPTTTQPGSAQDPAIDMTGTRQSAGAGVIGTARYAVPAGAIFVAPAGSDGASGTLANPYATVQHAIDVAPSGATIVLRAGSYHESVTIPATKQLVMQSYPGEAAWFDGSVPVTNWKRSGSVWAATGWNHVFDSSPTFTKGASDGTTDGWQWLNPAYPMAAHPDQIWVDGVAQQQVSNLGQVGTGRFYYDTAAHTLYLGTDPSAGNVRASDLQKAISIQGPNVVLRGFGVHRYAPSVPDMGAVTSWKGGATFENMAFNDNATTGLSIGGSGVTLRNVTAARNGLLGVQADKTDSLSVTGLLASGNDAERFNTSPVSGGLKVTRARGVQVSDSAFVRNFGQGLWMDESVYNMTFVNNDMIGNVGNGTVVEISANLVFANNLSTGNGGAGVKINDVSNVSVWNNTLTNNNRNINITQDSRRASNPSDFGHDPRQAFPDPTMTWVNKSIAIHNNVISGGNGNCLLCVEDYSHQYSAAQMQISSDGNVYQRPSANAPTWAVIWSRGAGDPAVYNTFALFTAATGQDAHSLVFDTAAGVNGTAPSAQVNSAQKSVAQPLPATVAVLVHQSQGTLHLGAW